jgi:hypothetical protein
MAGILFNPMEIISPCRKDGEDFGIPKRWRLYSWEELHGWCMYIPPEDKYYSKQVKLDLVVSLVCDMMLPSL